MIITIDRAEMVERLLDRLRAALPLPARTTPELAARLRAQDHALIEIPPTCWITWVTYLGDEAGVTCKLDFGRDKETDTKNPVFSSITHLRFDPRLPLAREIAVYQRHRVKRLKRAP